MLISGQVLILQNQMSIWPGKRKSRPGHILGHREQAKGHFA
jgi:hypothetical protein